MKNTYMIYPFKFCISVATSLTSFLLAISMLLINRLGSFLLFLIIAIVFLAVALINGSKLTIDDKGVRRTLFGKTLYQYSWEEIAEVGVIGTKVFRNDDKKDVGSRHLYFSREVLTDEERFRMVLQWPPRNKLYMLYNTERLSAVQSYWSGKIETYKAGDVFF